MNKLHNFSLAVACIALTACTPKPNLVVGNTQVNFTTKTVQVEVKNVGKKDAGNHLTYIEINEVGSTAQQKPQSQYAADVPSIAKGSSWNSGSIPFSAFSQPRGLDLSTLSSGNMVVSADAKNMVSESNENDNISDADYN